MLIKLFLCWTWIDDACQSGKQIAFCLCFYNSITFFFYYLFFLFLVHLWYWWIQFMDSIMIFSFYVDFFVLFTCHELEQRAHECHQKTKQIICLLKSLNHIFNNGWAHLNMDGSFMFSHNYCQRLSVRLNAAYWDFVC